MDNQTTSTTVDKLEILYWEARDDNNDALAEAIGLALDAAIEPESWADVARCGHRNCRTRCHFDHAPAHGIPRPRIALTFCQWCRAIECHCM